MQRCSLYSDVSSRSEGSGRIYVYDCLTGADTVEEAIKNTLAAARVVLQS